MTDRSRHGAPDDKRPILIVEDEKLGQRTIARAFEDRWPVRFAATVKAGLRALDETGPLAAVVIDARLPDGCGLDVLRHVRSKQPEVQALVYTFYDDDEVVNAALALGAEYAKKPTANLASFARRLAVRDLASSHVTCRYLDAFAHEHKLSLRETEVLALAVLDHGYEAIATRLGTSKSTVKAHARAIAEKCGDRSLGQLAWEIRSALREEHGSSAG